jgi:hypothetical protein
MDEDEVVVVVIRVVVVVVGVEVVVGVVVVMVVVVVVMVRVGEKVVVVVVVLCSVSRKLSSLSGRGMDLRSRLSTRYSSVFQMVSSLFLDIYSVCTHTVVVPGTSVTVEEIVATHSSPAGLTAKC